MVHLRPVLSDDEEFLFSVYSSTRLDEIALVDWNALQKETFLRMQFSSQDQYYKENYPGAQYQVILLDDKPVGRLYLHKRDDEIRIMDITLLPGFRKQGIGTKLLREILEEGANNNLAVTIHVERFNPALDLYERLGFHLAEDKGVYYFMKWLPAIKQQHELVG